MSYKEMAYSLIDRMTEKQIAGFIDLLTGYAAENVSGNEEAKPTDRADEAYDNIMRIIHPCPNLNDDYKQEYLDYLDERYGV